MKEREKRKTARAKRSQPWLAPILPEVEGSSTSQYFLASLTQHAYKNHWMQETSLSTQDKRGTKGRQGNRCWL